MYKYIQGFSIVKFVFVLPVHELGSLFLPCFFVS